AFPFHQGENRLLIVQRIFNGPRPQIIRHRDSIPSELAARTDLIEHIDRQLAKALAADPAQRHETIRDFLSSVEGALKAAQEERRSTQPATTPESAGSPFIATEPAFRNAPGLGSRRSAVAISPSPGPRPTPVPLAGGEVQSATPSGTPVPPAGQRP